MADRVDRWTGEVERAELLFTKEEKLMRTEELTKLVAMHPPLYRDVAETLLIGQVAVAMKRGDRSWRKSCLALRNS